MAKYKVGDLVKVSDTVSGSEWARGLMGGAVYRIAEAYDWLYKLEGYPDLIFSEMWLEPALPAFKFAIGDNVALKSAPNVRIGVVYERQHNSDNNAYRLSWQNQHSIYFSEDWLTSCVNNPVEEEVRPEDKKRKPLEVFAMLNASFDWYWDMSNFEISIGIRTADVSEHRCKTFLMEETKKAYKWLVKQALKLDEKMDGEFTRWYNGE
jgi:hypothetical protein